MVCPFEVLEKVGDFYILTLPPYMCIYLVVNVENLKLYEPSMLDQEIDGNVLPTIKDLALEAWEELAKDTILYKKSKTTRHGQCKL